MHIFCFCWFFFFPSRFLIICEKVFTTTNQTPKWWFISWHIAYRHFSALHTRNNTTPWVEAHSIRNKTSLPNIFFHIFHLYTFLRDTSLQFKISKFSHSKPKIFAKYDFYKTFLSPLIRVLRIRRQCTGARGKNCEKIQIYSN